MPQELPQMENSNLFMFPASRITHATILSGSMRTDQKGVEKREDHLLKQQFLYFFPLPHGQGDLRETDGNFVTLVIALELPRFARGALTKAK